VEILPVELPSVVRRGENDETDQSFVVKQWNSGPGCRLLDEPLRNQDGPVPCTGEAPAQCFELEDPSARFKLVPEISGIVERTHCGNIAAPAARFRYSKSAASIANEKQAAGC